MTTEQAHHTFEVALGNEVRCEKCGTYGKVKPYSPGLVIVIWPKAESSAAYHRAELGAIRCVDCEDQ